MFPSAIETLGGLGDGLSTEVWWSPSHPFKSSVTGQSAQQLAADYEKASGRQWTQPLGFAHALFEIAVDTFRRTKDIDSNIAVRDALAATNVNTIVGKVAWGNGPVRNVAKTPLVGGQWIRGQKHRFDLAIVSNQQAPAVPLSGPLRTLA
ncbi:hypothetical protein [Cupriavidus necator]|uniref:hypothetical protein n=1 Tax=Cupriavidus necator TaxID=106590 RepID=UPI000B033B51|nr:hypothetical protein [Cupriavidus necator]